MKRFVCIISAIFCIALASASGKFNFTWAVGSSGTFYGDSDFTTRFDRYKSKGCKNIVLAGELGMRLSFTDNIAFTLNALLNADTLTNLSDFCFFLDYGLAGGVKIYPGLGGLNIGMEYVTGMRADLVTGADDTFSSWGNGFRFLLEYEFENLINRFSPSLGFAWRRMPRGNSAADNVLSFYLRAPF